ncbi:MAG: hypothetical protein ACI97K_002897 [Glaciecola sp.]|jgi:hypothetical protein
MISKTNVIIFAILIIISITGAYYKFVNSTKSNQSECKVLSDICAFKHQYGEIRIEFVTEIQTEEEIILNIDIPEDLVLDEAWVEGVDMFMGKTPVVLENDKYVTFLGSCNLAKMKWRLNLKILNKNGQVQLYSAIFYTRQD